MAQAIYPVQASNAAVLEQEYGRILARQRRGRHLIEQCGGDLFEAWILSGAHDLTFYEWVEAIK